MSTLLILSRGCSARMKNILKDLERILVSVRENKYDQKNKFSDLRELMSMNDCPSIIYFESTKRIQYTWIGHEDGPSIRFITYNLFTMQDLSFPVNCLKECGHKLLFDKSFEEKEELVIVKNLFKSVFVEKDVYDRLICFYNADNKIWMRVYVLEENELMEMGPRIVLEIDKILENCFSGKIIFKNNELIQEKTN